MKKIFFGLSLVAALGACKQKTNLDTDRSMVLLSDSTNYNYNGYSDTGYNNQQVVSSGIFGVGSGYVATSAEPEVNEPVRTTSTKARTSSSTRRSSTSSGSGSSSSSSGTTASTVPAKKKGWSKAAKGAAIGGGAGAVAGAVIGKNAKGAIIGAVLGAGGGYIIGRSQDKKDGRY